MRSSISVILLLLPLLLLPARAGAQFVRGEETPLRRDGKGDFGMIPRAEGFGGAVAISGNEAFVGESRGTLETGNVSVLLRDGGGTWSKVATLGAPGGAPGNRFGERLDSDGEKLVVGAPGADDGKGLAYVFVRQSPGVWTHEGTLKSPMPHSGALFAATSISVSGDRIIVGEAQASGNQHGAAHLFQYDQNSGSWIPDTTLPPLHTSDRFGFGAAISGTHAAVGAYRWNNERGIVHIYERAAGSWFLDQSVHLTGALSNDRFGYTVDIDGNRITAGNYSINGIRPIGYRVIDYDAASAQWVIRDSVSHHGFVTDVDAGTVISGLYWANRALVASGDTLSGSWAPEDSLTGAGVSPGDNLGYDVALSGDYAIVGAPGDLTGVGSAHIFERNPDSSWSQVASFTGAGSIVSSITGPVSCSGGSAAGFECRNVDLRAFITTDDLDASAMSDIWGWTDPVTGHEYALAGHRDGTAFVDVTDPDDPVFVGTLPRHAGSVSSAWRDIKTYGNYAFIVADNAGPAGMQVFDLTELRDAQGLTAEAKSARAASLPETFSETAHYDAVSSSHNIAINDSSATAFIVGSNLCGGGIHLVDISTATAPDSTGCYADPTTGRASTGYTHDIQCVNYDGPDVEYQGRETCFGSNETAVLITDVTDNSNVVSVGKGEYPTSGYVHQGWLTPDHRHFFQDDELDESTGEVSTTRTLIWDVTDLDDPVLVYEYTNGNTSIDHNQYVHSDYLYQAQYSAGLRILDVSGITGIAAKTEVVVPTEVAFFDTRPGSNPTDFTGAWSVYPYFESGNVVVNSIGEGLFVLTPNLSRIEAEITVFLEGPYSGADSMSTTGSFQAAVPTANPYKEAAFVGTALELDVADSVNALPAGSIDWVQVELRTDPNPDSVAALRSAILLNDGSIVSPTGETLSFPGLSPGMYYVVVRHRNHLAVMSSNPVDFSSGSGAWDFTSSSDQAFGANPMRNLGDGKWGLFTGEAQLNGLNNTADFNEWLQATKAVVTGYELPDFDLDGQVTAGDFNLWLANTKAAAASQVPE